MERWLYMILLLGTLLVTQSLGQGRSDMVEDVLTVSNGSDGNRKEEKCPCISREQCPRVYGISELDFKELGQLDSCQDLDMVRCCGVTVTMTRKEDSKEKEETRNTEGIEDEQSTDFIDLDAAESNGQADGMTFSDLASSESQGSYKYVPSPNSQSYSKRRMKNTEGSITPGTSTTPVIEVKPTETDGYKAPSLPRLKTTLNRRPARPVYSSPRREKVKAGEDTKSEEISKSQNLEVNEKSTTPNIAPQPPGVTTQQVASAKGIRVSPMKKLSIPYGRPRPNPSGLPELDGAPGNTDAKLKDVQDELKTTLHSAQHMVESTETNKGTILGAQATGSTSVGRTTDVKRTPMMKKLRIPYSKKPLSSAEPVNVENTGTEGNAGNPGNVISAGNPGTAGNVENRIHSGNRVKAGHNLNPGNDGSHGSSISAGNPGTAENSGNAESRVNLRKRVNFGNRVNMLNRVNAGNPDAAANPDAAGNPGVTQITANAVNRLNEGERVNAGNVGNVGQPGSHGSAEISQHALTRVSNPLITRRKESTATSTGHNSESSISSNTETSPVMTEIKRITPLKRINSASIRQRPSNPITATEPTVTYESKTTHSQVEYETADRYPVGEYSSHQPIRVALPRQKVKVTVDPNPSDNGNYNNDNDYGNKHSYSATQDGQKGQPGTIADEDLIMVTRTQDVSPLFVREAESHSSVDVETPLRSKPVIRRKVVHRVKTVLKETTTEATPTPDPETPPPAYKANEEDFSNQENEAEFAIVAKPVPEPEEKVPSAVAPTTQKPEVLETSSVLPLNQPRKRTRPLIKSIHIRPTERSILPIVETNSETIASPTGSSSGNSGLKNAEVSIQAQSKNQMRPRLSAYGRNRLVVSTTTEKSPQDFKSATVAENIKEIETQERHEYPTHAADTSTTLTKSVANGIPETGQDGNRGQRVQMTSTYSKIRQNTNKDETKTSQNQETDRNDPIKIFTPIASGGGGRFAIPNKFTFPARAPVSPPEQTRPTEQPLSLTPVTQEPIRQLQTHRIHSSGSQNHMSLAKTQHQVKAIAHNNKYQAHTGQIKFPTDNGGSETLPVRGTYPEVKDYDLVLNSENRKGHQTQVQAQQFHDLTQHGPAQNYDNYESNYDKETSSLQNNQNPSLNSFTDFDNLKSQTQPFRGSIIKEDTDWRGIPSNWDGLSDESRITETFKMQHQKQKHTQASQSNENSNGPIPQKRMRMKAKNPEAVPISSPQLMYTNTPILLQAVKATEPTPISRPVEMGQTFVNEPAYMSSEGANGQPGIEFDTYSTHPETNPSPGSGFIFPPFRRSEAKLLVTSRPSPSPSQTMVEYVSTRRPPIQKSAPLQPVQGVINQHEFSKTHTASNQLHHAAVTMENNRNEQRPQRFNLNSLNTNSFNTVSQSSSNNNNNQRFPVNPIENKIPQSPGSNMNPPPQQPPVIQHIRPTEAPIFHQIPPTEPTLIRNSVRVEATTPRLVQQQASHHSQIQSHSEWANTGNHVSQVSSTINHNNPLNQLSSQVQVFGGSDRGKISSQNSQDSSHGNFHHQSNQILMHSGINPDRGASTNTKSNRFEVPNQFNFSSTSSTSGAQVMQESHQLQSVKTHGFQQVPEQRPVLPQLESNRFSELRKPEISNFNHQFHNQGTHLDHTSHSSSQIQTNSNIRQQGMESKPPNENRVAPTVIRIGTENEKANNIPIPEGRPIGNPISFAQHNQRPTDHKAEPRPSEQAQHNRPLVHGQNDIEIRQQFTRPTENNHNIPADNRPNRPFEQEQQLNRPSELSKMPFDHAQQQHNRVVGSEPIQHRPVEHRQPQHQPLEHGQSHNLPQHIQDHNSPFEQLQHQNRPVEQVQHHSRPIEHSQHQITQNRPGHHEQQQNRPFEHHPNMLFEQQQKGQFQQQFEQKPNMPMEQQQANNRPFETISSPALQHGQQHNRPLEQEMHHQQFLIQQQSKLKQESNRFPASILQSSSQSQNINSNSMINEGNPGRPTLPNGIRDNQHISHNLHSQSLDSEESQAIRIQINTPQEPDNNKQPLRFHETLRPQELHESQVQRIPEPVRPHQNIAQEFKEVNFKTQETMQQQELGRQPGMFQAGPVLTNQPHIQLNNHGSSQAVQFQLNREAETHDQMRPQQPLRPEQHDPLRPQRPLRPEHQDTSQTQQPLREPFRVPTFGLPEHREPQRPDFNEPHRVPVFGLPEQREPQRPDFNEPHRFPTFGLPEQREPQRPEIRKPQEFKDPLRPGPSPNQMTQIRIENGKVQQPMKPGIKPLPNSQPTLPKVIGGMEPPKNYGPMPQQGQSPYVPFQSNILKQSGIHRQPIIPPQNKLQPLPFPPSQQQQKQQKQHLQQQQQQQWQQRRPTNALANTRHRRTTAAPSMFDRIRNSFRISRSMNLTEEEDQDKLTPLETNTQDEEVPESTFDEETELLGELNMQSEDKPIQNATELDNSGEKLDSPGYLRKVRDVKDTKERVLKEDMKNFKPPKVITRGFYPILPYSEKDPGIILVPISIPPKMDTFTPNLNLNKIDLRRTKGGPGSTNSINNSEVNFEKNPTQN